MGDYLQQRQVFVSGRESLGRTGNTKAKETRISRTERLRIDVRNFAALAEIANQESQLAKSLTIFWSKSTLLSLLMHKGALRRCFFGRRPERRSDGSLIVAATIVASTRTLCRASSKSPNDTYT
jgi:hypothetical protein